MNAYATPRGPVTKEWIEAQQRVMGVLTIYLVTLRRSGNMIGQIDQSAFAQCIADLTDLVVKP